MVLTAYVSDIHLNFFNFLNLYSLFCTIVNLHDYVVSLYCKVLVPVLIQFLLIVPVYS